MGSNFWRDTVNYTHIIIILKMSPVRSQIKIAVVGLALASPAALAEFGAIGANRCTWGPGYWCAGAEEAQECGMTKWCQEKKMGAFASKAKLGGYNRCTWGPGYWCAGAEEAKQCGMTEWCQEKGMGAFASKAKLGEDPCTWGPGYWCAGAEE